MKFLSNIGDMQNIMPLNIVYEKGNIYKPELKDDYIDILYKDMDTGKKYVETIVHPNIEIWITKPEFRTFDYIRDYQAKNELYCITIPYKERYRILAEHLNISMGDVKTCQWIYQLDMQLEHFYMQQFVLNYGNELPKKLRKAFFDIENDVFNIEGFPTYGEAPIDCITYVSEVTKTAYTLLYTKDSLPMLPETHPDYSKVEYYRENFKKSMEELRNNPEIFTNLCHENFDEIYGVYDYNLLFFDEEIELIVAFFKIAEIDEPDFLGGWNSPYDFGTLVERPKALGYDPNSIIISDIYKKNDKFNRKLEFYEDMNPTVHKRQHVFKFYTPYIPSDMMVNYSGIRSARGKIPSLKLNAVAKDELKDEKINYDEEGDFKEFKYKNLLKFTLYNAKDVMLLTGLEAKTKDFDSAYAVMYDDACMYNEIFTSTREVEGSFRVFAYTYGNNGGYVCGTNKHKFEGDTLIDYQKMANDILGVTHSKDEIFMSKEDFDENDVIEELDENDIETYDPSDYEIRYDDRTSGDKSVKYKGAFVQNVEHISPTGIKIHGVESKYVHDNVGDQDVTSEYPSGVMQMNASNETMFAKVFFASNAFKLPKYQNYELIGNDETEYKKINISSWAMEQLTTNDYLDFAHVVLGLDDADTIIENFAKYIGE